MRFLKIIFKNQKLATTLIGVLGNNYVGNSYSAMDDWLHVRDI